MHNKCKSLCLFSLKQNPICFVSYLSRGCQCHTCLSCIQTDCRRVKAEVKQMFSVYIMLYLSEIYVSNYNIYSYVAWGSCDWSVAYCTLKVSQYVTVTLTVTYWEILLNVQKVLLGKSLYLTVFNDINRITDLNMGTFLVNFRWISTTMIAGLGLQYESVAVDSYIGNI